MSGALDLGRWRAEQWRWQWPDVLRLVGGLSVPAAWVYAGLPSGAVMFLVTGGQMLLRLLAFPRALDAAGQALMLLAGWLAVTGGYQAIPHSDVVVHAAVSALVAALVVRCETLLSPPGRRLGGAERVLHTVTAVATLGLVWEFGEWFGWAYLSPDIHVGYLDTMSDLAADLLGALIAAPLLVRAMPLPAATLTPAREE